MAHKLSDNRYFKALKRKSLLLHTLVLISLFALVFYYIFDADLNWGGDNFSYLDHAMKLLQGKGYVEPLLGNLDRPYNWFPPGYSAILAIVMIFVSTNIIALKILNGIFLIGSLLLLAQIIRNRTNSIAFAFATCLYIICNNHLLNYTTILMSEMSYIYFSMLAIYAVQLFNEKNNNRFWKSSYFYIIISASVISFYIRGVGVILIGAIFAQWFFQKKWKQAFSFLGISIALYLPWYIRNSLYGFGNRYTSVIFMKNPLQQDLGMIETIGDLLDKIGVSIYNIILKGMTNAVFPFINHTDIPPPPPFQSWVIAIGIVVVSLIIYGIMKQKPTLKWLLLAYLLGHFVVFILWDSAHDTRYIIPITPIIIYCLFFGIFDVFRKAFRLLKINIPYWVSYAFILLCLLQLPQLEQLQLIGKVKLNDSQKDYLAVASYARSLGKVNVVCRKPYVFRWYSECYTTMYPGTLDDRKMISYLVDKNAQYIVVDALGYTTTRKYLLPIMNRNLDLVQIVLDIKRTHTYLLKFNIEAAKKKYNL